MMKGQLLNAVGAGALFFFLSQSSWAVIEPVTISSDEKWPAPRWVFGEGEPPKGNSVESLLAGVKKAQSKKEHQLCVDRARVVRAKAKSLQAWLSVVEIDCALSVSPSRNSANQLFQSLVHVEKNPSWLLMGPQATTLRQTVLNGYSKLIEQDIKTNKPRAWKSIERMQELAPYMDSQAKAKLWRSAGELAFLQQKPEAARDFFRRSLREMDSQELRARLEAVEAAVRSLLPQIGSAISKEAGESMLLGAGVAGSGSVGPLGNPSLEASQAELELVDRITVALKSGDLLSAVEDSVKLIISFPGGVRADWAVDRIREVYTSMIDKNDAKYSHLRERMVGHFLKVDADRLADLARYMYNRGQYQDALKLSRKSLEGVKGSKSTKILELAAEAALASDQFEVAREALNELISKHAGTPQAREALLRSGILYYRKSAYGQAVADLERLLVLPNVENFEVTARYWLWRSLQKLKSERANAAADELMTKFPFTYYGLRARLEKNGNVLEWRPKPAKVESRLWLTGPERLALEKAQLLLRAGWLEEAQAELRELPQPSRAEDKAVRALLWAAASQYVTASRLANEAWDEKAELRRPPFVQATFPREFLTEITRQAESRNLDRDLVRSLIRQESSYNARAVSTANAMGLMQLLAPTAKEIAVDLKMTPLQVPQDLFDPKRNIQLGTVYLSRMMKKYQGSVPLALAAYNAGPGRMDRWIRSRPSLQRISQSQSSSPDEEIWFDEIPYWETSLYVKSILRNILLYRVLEEGRVEIPDPIWSGKAKVQ